jgi:hypothetical protein
MTPSESQLPAAASFVSSLPVDTVAGPVPVVAEAGALRPSAPVDPAHALLQLAMTDTSLSLDLHRQVVNVSLHTEAAGPLELELRLHEGQAHVVVEGPGSPLVAQHAPALREVLAQHGLTLGHFSNSQHSRDDRRAPEDGGREGLEASRATSSAASVSGPSPQRRHEGRIDIEA